MIKGNKAVKREWANLAAHILNLESLSERFGRAADVDTSNFNFMDINQTVYNIPHGATFTDEQEKLRIAAENFNRKLQPESESTVREKVKMLVHHRESVKPVEKGRFTYWI